MAVMIVRVYEYQTGTKSAAAAADFSDSTEVSTWAQSYVNAAYELGFIKGRGDNEFVPKGVATRGESAQVVSILVD
jgi:pullulanase